MRRWLLVGVAALLAIGAGRAMQYSGIPLGQPAQPGLGAGHGQEDDTPFSAREMRAYQARILREAHQKQVMTDSARLLQLAGELKAETDQGVTATPGELKQVDEIAKLAKRLSEHIKNQ